MIGDDDTEGESVLIGDEEPPTSAMTMMLTEPDSRKKHFNSTNESLTSKKKRISP